MEYEWPNCRMQMYRYVYCCLNSNPARAYMNGLVMLLFVEDISEWRERERDRDRKRKRDRCVCVCVCVCV